MRLYTKILIAIFLLTIVQSMTFASIWNFVRGNNPLKKPVTRTTEQNLGKQSKQRWYNQLRKVSLRRSTSNKGTVVLSDNNETPVLQVPEVVSGWPRLLDVRDNESPVLEVPEVVTAQPPVLEIRDNESPIHSETEKLHAAEVGMSVENQIEKIAQEKFDEMKQYDPKYKNDIALALGVNLYHREHQTDALVYLEVFVKHECFLMALSWLDDIRSAKVCRVFPRQTNQINVLKFIRDNYSSKLAFTEAWGPWEPVDVNQDQATSSKTSSVVPHGRVWNLQNPTVLWQRWTVTLFAKSTKTNGICFEFKVNMTPVHPSIRQYTYTSSILAGSQDLVETEIHHFLCNHLKLEGWLNPVDFSEFKAKNYNFTEFLTLETVMDPEIVSQAADLQLTSARYSNGAKRFFVVLEPNSNFQAESSLESKKVLLIAAHIQNALGTDTLVPSFIKVVDSADVESTAHTFISSCSCNFWYQHLTDKMKTEFETFSSIPPHCLHGVAKRCRFPLVSVVEVAWSVFWVVEAFYEGKWKGWYFIHALGTDYCDLELLAVAEKCCTTSAELFERIVATLLGNVLNEISVLPEDILGFRKLKVQIAQKLTLPFTSRTKIELSNTYKVDSENTYGTVGIFEVREIIVGNAEEQIELTESDQKTRRKTTSRVSLLASQAEFATEVKLSEPKGYYWVAAETPRFHHTEWELCEVGPFSETFAGTWATLCNYIFNTAFPFVPAPISGDLFREKLGTLEPSFLEVEMQIFGLLSRRDLTFHRNGSHRLEVRPSSVNRSNIVAEYYDDDKEKAFFVEILLRENGTELVHLSSTVSSKNLHTLQRRYLVDPPRFYIEDWFSAAELERSEALKTFLIQQGIKLRDGLADVREGDIAKSQQDRDVSPDVREGDIAKLEQDGNTKLDPEILTHMRLRRISPDGHRLLVTYDTPTRSFFFAVKTDYVLQKPYCVVYHSNVQPGESLEKANEYTKNPFHFFPDLIPASQEAIVPSIFTSTVLRKLHLNFAAQNVQLEAIGQEEGSNNMQLLYKYETLASHSGESERKTDTFYIGILAQENTAAAHHEPKQNKANLLATNRKSKVLTTSQVRASLNSSAEPESLQGSLVADVPSSRNLLSSSISGNKERQKKRATLKEPHMLSNSQRGGSSRNSLRLIVDFGNEHKQPNNYLTQSAADSREIAVVKTPSTDTSELPNRLKTKQPDHEHTKKPFPEKKWTMLYITPPSAVSFTNEEICGLFQTYWQCRAKHRFIDDIKLHSSSYSVANTSMYKTLHKQIIPLLTSEETEGHLSVPKIDLIEIKSHSISGDTCLFYNVDMHNSDTGKTVTRYVFAQVTTTSKDNTLITYESRLRYVSNRHADLKVIQSSAEKYADAKFSLTVIIPTPDEIRSLSEFESTLVSNVLNWKSKLVNRITCQEIWSFPELFPRHQIMIYSAYRSEKFDECFFVVVELLNSRIVYISQIHLVQDFDVAWIRYKKNVPAFLEHKTELKDLPTLTLKVIDKVTENLANSLTDYRCIGTQSITVNEGYRRLYFTVKTKGGPNGLIVNQDSEEFMYVEINAGGKIIHKSAVEPMQALEYKLELLEYKVTLA